MERGAGQQGEKSANEEETRERGKKAHTCIRVDKLRYGKEGGGTAECVDANMQLPYKSERRHNAG